MGALLMLGNRCADCLSDVCQEPLEMVRWQTKIVC